MTLLPSADHDERSPLIGWLTPLWTLSIVAGAFLLRTIGSGEGNELPADRALFVATNAATLTGFGGAGLEGLLPMGRLVVLALTAFGTFYALVLGGSLLTRAIGLAVTDRQIIRATLVIEAFVLLGITPLFMPVTGSVLAAAQLALGAFGNSGIAWGRVPDASAWQTHLVLLPLAVLGGLGVPVLLDVLNRVRRRTGSLSSHTVLAGRLSAMAYLLGLVAIIALFAIESLDENGRLSMSLPTVAASASVAAIDSRSLGLDIEAVASWPRSVSWMVMVLMAIGACPGGAGGGILLTTFALLWTGVRRAFAGKAPGRPFAVAFVWTTVYLMAIGLTTISLVATASQGTGDRLLFLAISALGTVGLAHDPVSLVGAPLHILTCAMLFGRLAPLAMLWWMGRATRVA